MLRLSQAWASASSPFIYFKPTYFYLTQLKYMIHIYLYKNRITVKSLIKAVQNIYLTQIKKAWNPRIFSIFFIYIKK